MPEDEMISPFGEWLVSFLFLCRLSCKLSPYSLHPARRLGATVGLASMPLSIPEYISIHAYRDGRAETNPGILV